TCHELVLAVLVSRKRADSYGGGGGNFGCQGLSPPLSRPDIFGGGSRATLIERPRRCRPARTTNFGSANSFPKPDREDRRGLPGGMACDEGHRSEDYN